MSTSEEKVRNLLASAPLSKAMRAALRLVRKVGASDVERWLRLELGGYYASNSAMDEDVVVPQYRTVVGQHVDLFGRMFVVPPDLAIVNETRLRNSVEELEALKEGPDMLVVHDPHMCELIREHLQVDVHYFRFSRVHVVGILAAIQTELETKLGELNLRDLSQRDQADDAGQAILELRPNIHGIGINLRALWKRLTRGS